MGFKNTPFFFLSPFYYPYDLLSHIVLGAFAYKRNNMIVILLSYQVLNFFFGDEYYDINERMNSIFEYFIGMNIMIIYRKIKNKIIE